MSDREGRFVPVERIDTAFTISTEGGQVYTVQPSFYNRYVSDLVFPAETNLIYSFGGQRQGYYKNVTTSDPTAVNPINKAVLRYYRKQYSGPTIVDQIYLFENPNTYDEFLGEDASGGHISSSVISNYYIFYYNGKKYGWRGVKLDEEVDPYGIEGVISSNNSFEYESFAVAAMLLGRTIPSGVPLPVPVQWDSTKYGKLYQDSCEIKVSQ